MARCTKEPNEGKTGPLLIPESILLQRARYFHFWLFTLSVFLYNREPLSGIHLLLVLASWVYGQLPFRARVAEMSASL